MSARWLGAALCVTLCLGCGEDEGVSSEEEARQAYLGLEQMIDRAMDLGFDGFNAATSANIPPQTASGALGGTLTVSGQVDQGSSDNKEMRLDITLVDYADIKLGDTALVYDTGDPKPSLDMSLKKIPSGTMTGTLSGAFVMTGALSGEVTLQLGITSDLEPDPQDSTKVRRKPGTVEVSGTATSPFGVYTVQLTL